MLCLEWNNQTNITYSVDYAESQKFCLPIINAKYEYLVSVFLEWILQLAMASWTLWNIDWDIQVWQIGS